MSLGRGKDVWTHRVAYGLWIGDPSGQTVHHKCAVRNCFNPDHLELASQRENVLESFERRALYRRIAELEAQVASLTGEVIDNG